jgi:hypothetical protein
VLRKSEHVGEFGVPLGLFEGEAKGSGIYDLTVFFQGTSFRRSYFIKNDAIFRHEV